MRFIGLALAAVCWLAGWCFAAAPASVEVEVSAGSVERQNAVAEVNLDNLPRAPTQVVEIGGDGGNALFQFDASGEQPSAGTLVLLLKGRTAPDAPRRFRVLFDAPKPGAPPKPLITLEDNVPYKGQASYRIQTPVATWYYQKAGGGFAGLITGDGEDWIGFHPKGGSAGKYRGIPNLVHPEGHFHPGNTGCTTRVVAQGPLKITLESQAEGGRWLCRWEMYPTLARLTVERAPKAYWFLYEGTPGGRLEPGSDFCIRSPGVPTLAKEKWQGDLPGLEWVVFGDPKVRWALALAHHEDDKAVDSYWPMEGNMTVFGFGRAGLEKHLSGTPQHFTVGFVPCAGPKDTAGVAAAVRAMVEPLQVTVRRPAEP